MIAVSHTWTVTYVDHCNGGPFHGDTGVVLLGESFTVTMLVGGAMIATAVLLLQWAGRTKREAVA